MLNKFSRRQKQIVGGLAGLIALLTVLLALLPSITKWYAIQWLEAQGVTATIGNVKFNLSDGQFRFRTIQVTGPEKHQIKLGEILVQVHLRDILDHRLTIENVEFSDFHIDIYQQKGKPLNVGGILLGKPAGNSQVIKEKSEETDPWEIVVQDITFKNVETCLETHNQQGNLLYNDCLVLGDLSWDGYTSYLIGSDSKNPADNLGVNLSFVLKNLKLHDNTDNSDVATIETLRVEKLAIKGLDDIRIGSLKLENYRIFQREQQGSEDYSHVATIGHITISGTDIKHLNEYTISDVKVDSLQTYMLRNQKGEFEPIVKMHQLLFPETAHDPANKKKTDVVKTEAQKRTLVRIDKLVLEGDSQIIARDDLIKPRYAGKIKDIRVQLANIDSSRPENRSPVNFSFLVGEYGKVKFNGDIALFSRQPTGKLKGTIRNLDATDFSAYIKSSLQNHIKSGQIDADIELAVKHGQLDSVFNLIVRKFYVEQLTTKEANVYEEKLGVPLSTALSLLREQDDSIRLKLPVTGDIKNPNFSLGNTIRKVMIDAVRTAVINYYTPFGLVSLSKAAFNLATELRFEPVLFEPLKTDIMPNSTEHLDKIVALLKERPNIRLVICGQSTLDDRFSLYPLDEAVENQARDTRISDDEDTVDINTLLPKLDEAQQAKLDALATERGNRVRDYLAKDKAVDPARLIMCKPIFNNDQGKPRVEISI